MGDAEFVEYVFWHSQTPVGLFSEAHIIRFAKLAQLTNIEALTGCGWRSLDHFKVAPLCEKIRARLRETKETT